MSDLDDLELGRTETAVPSPAPPRPVGLWVTIALLVVAAAVAAYIVFGTRAQPAPPRPVPATRAPSAAPTRPLGAAAEPIELPPLDQTDPIVRTLVERISKNPAVAAWLATRGLVRNFTVVVTNIAEGTSPAKELGVLRPRAAFAVLDRGGSFDIDPASYHRYDVAAQALQSIDPAGAAQAYATLKPRIQQAYAELGLQQPSFDRVLERAILALLNTPIVNGPIAVVPKGIGYAYADSRLEGLTPAQRQLLRAGPDNVRIVQDALRRIALALGVPEQDLASAGPRGQDR